MTLVFIYIVVYNSPNGLRMYIMNAFDFVNVLYNFFACIAVKLLELSDNHDISCWPQINIQANGIIFITLSQIMCPDKIIAVFYF